MRITSPGSANVVASNERGRTTAIERVTERKAILERIGRCDGDACWVAVVVGATYDGVLLVVRVSPDGIVVGRTRSAGRSGGDCRRRRCEG